MFLYLLFSQKRPKRFRIGLIFLCPPLVTSLYYLRSHFYCRHQATSKSSQVYQRIQQGTLFYYLQTNMPVLFPLPQSPTTIPDQPGSFGTTACPQEESDSTLSWLICRKVKERCPHLRHTFPVMVQAQPFSSMSWLRSLHSTPLFSEPVNLLISLFLTDLVIMNTGNTPSNLTLLVHLFSHFFLFKDTLIPVWLSVGIFVAFEKNYNLLKAELCTHPWI